MLYFLIYFGWKDEPSIPIKLNDYSSIYDSSSTLIEYSIQIQHELNVRFLVKTEISNSNSKLESKIGRIFNSIFDFSYKPYKTFDSSFCDWFKMYIYKQLYNIYIFFEILNYNVFNFLIIIGVVYWFYNCYLYDEHIEINRC